MFDLLIGTEEESMIAGGSADIMASLRALRAVSTATLVVKRGPLGCAVIDGALPLALDAFNYCGIQTQAAEIGPATLQLCQQWFEREGRVVQRRASWAWSNAIRAA